MSAESMRAEYNAAMNNAKIMAFTQVIHRHPEVSIKEMVDFADEVGLKDLTIGELRSLPKDGKGWTKRLALPKSGAKALSSAKADRPAVNTRTAEGRKDHDNSVLSYLKGYKRWASSVQVSEVVGGTTKQARQSLNRLIEQGLVMYKGRTHGTRYRFIKD